MNKLSIVLLLYMPIVSYSETLNSNTFGQFDSASGFSVLVNNKKAKPEISGFRNKHDYAKYINHDHVGVYIGMYGPENQLKVDAKSINYTEEGFYFLKKIDFSLIKSGMFVSTVGDVYSAKIISVDPKYKFIKVDGWFKFGNQSDGQVPLKNLPLIINSADKIWGQNTNVFINKFSTAKTATGYELGISSDGSHGFPIWGFHVVNLSNIGRPFDQAFRVTGLWNTGLYVSSSVDNVIKTDGPRKSVLNVDTSNHDWNGNVIELNTNNKLSNSYIINSQQDKKTVFSVKADGTLSNNRRSFLEITNSKKLSIDSPSIIICNNKNNIQIFLPDEGELSGVIYEFVSNSNFGSVSIISKNQRFLLSSNGYKYLKLINDGKSWILINGSKLSSN